MAAEGKQKADAKPKGDGKPKGEGKPKGDAKPKGEGKDKKAKGAGETAGGDAQKPAPPPPPPRTPFDPRMRFLKQFRSKLLPKGELRDRYNALMQRWDSADHGGVTVAELKSLLDERKTQRANRFRAR